MTTYSRWPAQLPQRPIPPFVGTPQNNQIAFRPSIGRPITRRRGSSTIKIYQAAFDFNQYSQVEIFEEWFSETLLDGVNPYIWADPMSDMEYLWKFAGDDTPYQLTANRGTYFELSFKIVRLELYTGP